MKKYLQVAVFLIACTALKAQDDAIKITGTNKISKKMTPQQVIDSLHKHFPNAKAVKYYQLPADAAARGWQVAEEDNLGSADDLDYYTLSFKNDDLQYYGLYNKHGDLISSKMTEKLDQLPAPITESLKSMASQYPGYKVVSKTFYKHQDYSKSKEYYEVVASNGNEKKEFYYAPDGTLTKVK